MLIHAVQTRHGYFIEQSERREASKTTRTREGLCHAFETAAEKKARFVLKKYSVTTTAASLPDRRLGNITDTGRDDFLRLQSRDSCEPRHCGAPTWD